MRSKNPLLQDDEVLSPSVRAGQSVKIVGLGGVGAIAARYGAMFLESLSKDGGARMVLIDGDEFELSNGTRMFFSGFGNKAAVTREDLLSQFADSNLGLVAVEEYVDEENVERLIRNGDIVICAVDRHASRKLLSDHCSQLDDVVLISGGNDGVGKDSSGRTRRGTYGNVQVYVRSGGKDLTPPLTAYHPEIASPADVLPTDASCTEMLMSVPQLLMSNMAVASAMLNAMMLHMSGKLHYSEICFDVADGQMCPLPFPGPVTGG